MNSQQRQMPDLGQSLYLVYVGMETDLIFGHGMDLPGFASFPLLETEAGQQILLGYYRKLIALGREAGMGVILESPTWVAHHDRGAALGYSLGQLDALNRQAIALMAGLREDGGDLPTIISGNIGPRDDAYAPGDQMTADEAQAYHADQITALAGAGVDLVSGYTLADPIEAIGLVRAAQQVAVPVVISFTVETDGRLPTGGTLKDAIAQVDDATGGYASYFMINCAHPEHFSAVLAHAPWMSRVGGIVANASRCSHAELDEATELDDGDPIELGQQLADICRIYPGIRVVGGCCGTDMRHMSEIAKAATQVM